MQPTSGPLPGHPSTYQTVPNDHRRWGVSSEIVLVPINDRIRNRTLFAKVERRSFDSLPEGVRNAAWFIVRDGTATDDTQFTVRVWQGKTQVSLARLIAAAKPGEFVRNVTGNRLDLRTTNLTIKNGALGLRSKRNDLALAKENTPA